MQVPAPLHAPLHPVNAEPVMGVAVSVTFVPLEKVALQLAPQSIPPGLEATAPVPVPALVVVSVKLCRASVALTFCA